MLEEKISQARDTTVQKYSDLLIALLKNRFLAYCNIDTEMYHSPLTEYFWLKISPLDQYLLLMTCTKFNLYAKLRF